MQSAEGAAARYKGPAPYWAVAALAIGVLAIGVAHATRYFPFLVDDALISLRYARQLIDGNGLVWNPGERVEGYSNLLFTVLVAGFGYAGVDLIVASRIIGLLSVGAMVAALYARAGHGRRDWATVVGASGGALVLALSGPIVVWMIGGLETTLAAALILWGIVFVERALLPEGSNDRRSIYLAGACLGLGCLTRPDTPLFVAMVALAILIARGIGKSSIQLIIRLCAIPVALVLLQIIGRLAYYHDWLPNTAYIKTGFNRDRALEGAMYLGRGLWSISPVVVVAGIAILRRGPFPGARSLWFLPSLAWCAYVVRIGGDIFPGRRHIVPIIALLAIPFSETITSVLRQTAVRRTWRVAGILASIGALVLLQHRDPHNRAAISEQWVWDGEVIGRVLKAGFRRHDPLLAVSTAGCLPYWSELRALDTLGLNDKHIARQPPAPNMMLAHDHGDGEYVFARAPDIVMFCSWKYKSRGLAPCFKTDRELLAKPEFHRDYGYVAIEGEHPYRFRSGIWLRIEGRVGILRDRDSLELPAQLFATKAEQPARLGSAGGFETEILGHSTATTPAFSLQEGTWSVEADLAGGTVEWSIGTNQTVLLDSTQGKELTLTQPTSISMTLRTGSAAATVRHVSFRRRPPI
jgi:arabinofuranosyltransferase